VAQQYGVDIVAKVVGTPKVEKLDRALRGLEKSSGKAARQLPGVGRGAAAAGRGAASGAVGVKAFSAAVKTALGPISAAVAAVAGLGAAFQTLKAQDFAEAKFQTLGGNADDLVRNLKAVSNELQGQASVAELTGAAYDVASAGFSSAAEASQVLKAASQGATGGFSDINTVANATTSVLNAYGMEASSAAKLVDQFVQTQNDGKIVVAEYAANIGKVASAAAGLNVPMSEVNAVIAQSTAAGVQAEVAFTGLKGALARLASGEAAKALKGTGIEINAATIEADGLLGTLKKLEGLDTGTIFKALGTEAGPALLPVIQNLEKYEELVLNQEQANGTAAAAAATAAGTIEGAWKRVTVAFQNLFSDQSELGQAIRFSLLAAAATVEALAAAFKLVLTPIRAVIQAVGAVVSAVTGIKDGEAILKDFTKVWFDIMKAVEDVSQTVIAVGQVIGQYVGALINEFTGLFSGLWTSITEGVQGVYGAITGVFTDAFNAVKGIIEQFWNGLPEWLKGALSAAGDVAGGVVNAVSGALSKVGDDINKAKGLLQEQSSAGGAPTGGKIPTPTPTPIPTPSGGAAGAVRESQVPQLQQELALKQRLFALDQQIAQQSLLGNEANVKALEIEKLKEQSAFKQWEISQQKIPFEEQELQRKLQMLELEGQIAELNNTELQQQQEKQERFNEIIEDLEHQVELSNATTDAARDLLEVEREIAKLREEGVITTEQQAANYKTAALNAKGASRQSQGGAGKEILGTLKSGLGNVISTAIKGGDVKAALEQMMGQILDKIINIMLDKVFEGLLKSLEAPAKAVVEGGAEIAKGGADGAAGAAEQVAAAAEGAASAALEQTSAATMTAAATQQVTAATTMVTAAAQQMAAAQLMAATPGFADGGRPPVGKVSVVGERGPELFIPDTPGTVISNEESQAALARFSPGNETGSDVGEGFGGSGEEGDAPVPMNFSFSTVKFADEDYVSSNQLQEAMATATQMGAKQGEARTLRRLQMSPTTRRRTGF